MAGSININSISSTGLKSGRVTSANASSFSGLKNVYSISTKGNTTNAYSTVYEPYEEINYSDSSSNSSQNNQNSNNVASYNEPAGPLTFEQMIENRSVSIDKLNSYFENEEDSKKVIEILAILGKSYSADEYGEIYNNFSEKARYNVELATAQYIFTEAEKNKGDKFIKDYFNIQVKNDFYDMDKIPVNEAGKRELEFYKSEFNKYQASAEYYKYISGEIGFQTAFQPFGIASPKDIVVDGEKICSIGSANQDAYAKKASELAAANSSVAEDYRRKYFNAAKRYYKLNWESKVSKKQLEDFKKQNPTITWARIQENLTTENMSMPYLQNLLMSMVNYMSKDELYTFLYLAEKDSVESAKEYLRLFMDRFNQSKANEKIEKFKSELDGLADEKGIMGWFLSHGYVDQQGFKDGLDSLWDNFTGSDPNGLPTDYTENDWEKILILQYLGSKHPNLKDDYEIFERVGETSLATVASSIVLIASAGNPTLSSLVYNAMTATNDYLAKQRGLAQQGYDGKAATYISATEGLVQFSVQQVLSMVLGEILGKTALSAEAREFIQTITSRLAAKTVSLYASNYIREALSGAVINRDAVNLEEWDYILKTLATTSAASGSGMIFKTSDGFEWEIKPDQWTGMLAKLAKADGSGDETVFLKEALELAAKNAKRAVPDIKDIVSIFTVEDVS